MITVLITLVVAGVVTWALMTNHPRPVWRPATEWEMLMWHVKQFGVSINKAQQALLQFGVAAAELGKTFQRVGIILKHGPKGAVLVHRRK